MNKDFVHKSVLLEQAVEALVTDDCGIYVDATFGRGGHARHILSKLATDGQLFAIDRDPAAIEVGRELEKEDSRFTIEHGSFTSLEQFAENNSLVGKVNGILLDLGVSSPQLDDADRGFSFQHDGPLDMLMDPCAGLSASDLINSSRESEIADVLKRFGEERYARRIARAIVNHRNEQPITSTGRLAEIVKQAHPRWERDKHPATRAFQGIRIFINQELDCLRQVLEQALRVLAVGGRLVVISFHSLEDKIVKKFISLQTKGDNFPRDLPVTHSQLQPTLRSIGKAVRPNAGEVEANPRSRSATMRVAERLA
ncbi:MAG: 16S rRNA (cytosine(1402)-N(4))-methyltransferase RsmH [Gammaproteobacteria bacterium]|nr:16S rRNA (cytosine(1402)-N(4))-methyltransferase RsmH [Gammaproteobacteria bacterium]